jgi:hypothetical protein
MLRLQMRVEEVDEVQLQAAGSSGTGMTFMRTCWSHLGDAAAVRVRVHLVRWLNGCLVGKQDNAVRLCNACAESASAHDMTAIMTTTAAPYFHCNTLKYASDSQNCSV